ncbi:MAG TPA: undecaprenyl diphosphate synthase family protein, partial [Acidimicrobiales bacterium]|nr:undecaprenyl diphosphate synthase family protein [Acidimicrobiales bacterium]
LYQPDMPDPDLVVRTSGEYRLSNFLLWEVAYSEMVFTDVLWPDFRREDLFDAIREYQSRHRRFGGVQEKKRRVRRR